ncbi:hypothetical protein ACFP1Z_12595 [Streptomyces gamaensis]|uniref:Uncharacterized protein n=1 Tax=Streptomyces gamaensis TaxID=1763542 RepID=A0ABW0YYZ6_9ACTN
MGWSSEFGSSHEGRTVAVLADGSEPKPAYFDVGSSGFVPSTDKWWVYDGEGGRPRATHVRGACSCGWRGTPLHAVEWAQDDDGPCPVLDEAVTSRDWERHIADVRARTVPLPTALEELIRQVERSVDDLSCEAPLAALRALTVLERIVTDVGCTAACNARSEKTTEEIARALGMTEGKAGALLHGYGLRRR